MSIEKNELFIPSLKLFAEHLNEGKSAEDIFNIVLSALTDPETMHFKFVSATSRFRINSPIPEVVNFWKGFYDGLYNDRTLSDFLLSVSGTKSTLWHSIKEAEISGTLSVLLSELKSDREIKWKGEEHLSYSVNIDDDIYSPLYDFANMILISSIKGNISKIIIGGALPVNQESISCPEELNETLNEFDCNLVLCSIQGTDPIRSIYFLTSMGWVEVFQIPDSIIQRLINLILLMGKHFYWDKLDETINFDLHLENGHFVTFQIQACTEINRTLSISIQRHLRVFTEVDRYTEEDLKPRY